MKTKRLGGNIEDFVVPISNLLKEGENFIDLSTSLYPTFYNKNELQDTIKKSVEKVSRFRILLDRDANIDALKKDVSWIFDLRDEYPNTLEIAKAGVDIEHWILVDEKYFRIETIHKHWEKNEIISLRNLIIEDPPRVFSKAFIQQFNYWWDISERV